jgi:hypothetical protein
MLDYSIINKLRTYAKSKNFAFFSGSEFFQNYEADQSIQPNQLVLTADFNARPTILNSRTVAIQYAGVMMLGRKSETTTASNLDETFIQKYDLRLEYLMQELASNIGEFACTNELEILSLEFRLELNKFDSSIDFVAGVVTFKSGL